MGSNTQNRKNTSGCRSDIGWVPGIEVDNNPRKIKCIYCNEIIPGNIYRFKHHLACTKKDAKACNSVPVEVKEQMFRLLKESSKRKMINNEKEMVESVPHKRGKVTESFSNTIIGTTQSTLNQNFEQRLRDEACQQIARFFHTSGIPFSCAKNPEFAKMLELVGKCGSEFVPPSSHELENSYVENKIKNTTDMLAKYKYEWKKTGCSIICNEWTDMKGRFYCNFLVNNPMGTIFLKSIDTSNLLETIGKVFKMLDEIVEEIGEENVVQVITNNASNYKVAMKMLIEKRKKILWSPCVTQLLDEILEDFEKNLSHHRITIAKGKKITKFIYSRIEVISVLRHYTSKDLIGPTTTPSASAYLTLLYLIDMREPLMEMFLPDHWKFKELIETKEGEEVHQIVQDCEFWNDIVDCLKFALPIIEVSLKIDSDEELTMGFICEEMRRAKKSLQSLNNVKGFETIWKIIKQRWNPQLHPQYLASYFLNPRYRCGIFEFPDKDLLDYIIRMVFDHDNNLDMTEENKLKIEHQFRDFLRGRPDAIFGIHPKDPAKWWDSYGNNWPELQRTAIRLLSLTCSSGGSGKILNAYKQICPKKRTDSCRRKLNDLFLVIQSFKSKTHKSNLQDISALESFLNPFSDNEFMSQEKVGEVSGAKKDILVHGHVHKGPSRRTRMARDAHQLFSSFPPEIPSFDYFSGNEVGPSSHYIHSQSAVSAGYLDGLWHPVGEDGWGSDSTIEL